MSETVCGCGNWCVEHANRIVNFKSLESERDRLKAELEEKSKALDQNDIAWARNHALIADRDLWKEKAFKLAEALTKIAVSVNGSETTGKWVRDNCQAALAEFEK